MSRPLGVPGLPLSWLYRALVELRNRRYDRAGAQLRVELPVVSIGNLSAGGTGKTPLVAYLAGEALARDLIPAIVSRGYGGRAGRGPVLVSNGTGPLCSAAVCGDEPFMLAGAHPGAIVVVGSDRHAAAVAAQQAGAGMILLDDGFQHRRLARDLEIVLIDRTRPFTHDRLIPAGYLREPPGSLARADVILITRSASAEGAASLEQAIRAVQPTAPIFHVDHRAHGFRDAAGASIGIPRRAVAFCGIGNPERFRLDLLAQGVELAAFHALRDHQPIAAQDLERFSSQAAALEATLVTTEKDLARIGSAVGATRLAVLTIAAQFDDPARFLEIVWRTIEEKV